MLFLSVKENEPMNSFVKKSVAELKGGGVAVETTVLIMQWVAIVSEVTQ